MSTDIEEVTEEQIDAQLEDDPNPATDLEGAVLQEQQEAALEYGSEVAEEKPEPEEDPDSVVTRLALAHLYDVQDRLDAAVEDHAEKNEVAKTAKKRVESLQEDLSDAVRKLRSAKGQTEPDPERYPLLDRAKQEINEVFSGFGSKQGV